MPAPRAPVPGYTPALAPDAAPVPSALHPPIEGAERVVLIDHAYAKHTRQSSADEASFSGWTYATEPEVEPWWEIDLGAARYVEHVTLWLAPAPEGTEVRVVAHAIQTRRGAPAAESPSWQAQTKALPVASDGSIVLPLAIDAVARYLRVSLRHARGTPVALLVRGAQVLGARLFGLSLLASYARAFTLFADRPLFSARASPGEGAFEVTHRYRDVWTAARHLASALAGALEPAGRERVFLGLCTRNRAEWIIGDLAALMRGYVVAPLSPDDSDERLAGILARCPLTAVLVEEPGGARFARLAARCPSLRLIVTCEPDGSAVVEGPPRASFAELVARGAARPAPDAAPRDQGDLYTLGFTSGSSGVPKGAMRKYATFLAMVQSYGVAQPAVHLSFQPLSHLSERMYMPAVILQGGLVGFSAGGAHVLSDLRALEPSDLGSVPRLYEIVLAGHERRLAAALAASPGEARDDVEARVLAGTRGVFGSRLQILSVGSAPCSPEVFAFMERCFGDVWVSNGYGSTECGTIAEGGRIMANVEVKLVPAAGLAGLAEGEAERGEIWVRSPHMIDGYFGDPEASRASLDADGFFATGDLGERLPGGGVRVVGRVKNVVKLGQGEFVAVDRIEAELASCPLVDQIFVSPDASSSALLAVVVPRFEALGPLLGVPDAAPADLAALPAAGPLLLRALGEHGRRAGLASFELPRAVLVEPDPMTAANGLLTSSGKLSRPAAAAHYAPRLAALGRDAPPPPAGDSLMDKLAAVVGGVVGRVVDPEEPLHTGGMAVDSLVAAEVLSAAAAALGREIPLGLWFEARSLADLAQRLDRGTLGARAPAFDLPARDRDLDLPAPAAGAGAGRVPFETVVLTGATGLLGAHLLESLVARTRARVVCLVRAASDEAAAARVRATLDRYRIPCPAQDRWTARAADLAAPGLGMAPARRIALAGEADAILHAGAEVSWIHPYEKLRAPNVLGTLEVLSLATASRRVPVHFVSTISTAPGVGDETTTLSFERARAGGGYGLTKWIAEHLVKRAAAEGHPAAVYRPAMIGGHSRRGLGNPDDYVNRYLRACVTSGRYLDLPGERLDMTPVDFVADGIVALMTAHPEGGSTYHLTNVDQSMTYRALGEAIAGAGHACAPAGYAAFVEAAVKPKGSPLAPLAAYFPAAGFGLGMGPWPSATTRAALAALGVACPEIDAPMVAAYLAGLAPAQTSPSNPPGPRF